MSTVDFSFGQIEAICADLNRIASDKRVAFMGRIKQLQKWFTQDEKARRPGRGKAGTYRFSDVMRFVIAVELIQSGIMPQMAAKLVMGSWPLLRTNIYVCSFAPEDTIGFGSKPTEYLWLLDVEALRSLTSAGEGEWDHMERIWTVPIEEAADALAKGVSSHPANIGKGWRTLVLNGYNLTQRVMKLIAFHFGYASRLDLRRDIEDEIEAEDARIRGMGKILDEGGVKLTPEQRDAAMQSFQKLLSTDFSTNPPTPRHVYVERAQDMIRFLPKDVKEFLRKVAPGEFEINEQTKLILTQLIDLGIIGIEGVDNDEGVELQSIVVTNYGEVLLDQLGGVWSEKINQRERERAHTDPLRQEAELIIARLSEEQREAIRDRDDGWVKEPLFSEFERLGLALSTDGDIPDTTAYFLTDLGRAVLMSLRFGKWRTDGREPWERLRDEEDADNGHDQEA